MDDIVVVILIAIAMSFFAGSDTNIGLLIGKKVLFFAILIVLAKWFIPHFIKLFKKFRVTESILSAGLIICFGLSYFAEFLGIAGIIGAFLRALR